MHGARFARQSIPRPAVRRRDTGCRNTNKNKSACTKASRILLLPIYFSAVAHVCCKVRLRFWVYILLWCIYYIFEISVVFVRICVIVFLKCIHYGTMYEEGMFRPPMLQLGSNIQMDFSEERDTFEVKLLLLFYCYWVMYHSRSYGIFFPGKGNRTWGRTGRSWCGGPVETLLAEPVSQAPHVPEKSSGLLYRGTNPKTFTRMEWEPGLIPEFNCS